MTDTTAPESMRLFVAIELPEAWKQGLGALQDEIRGALSGETSLAKVRIRWVRPEAIHLTLKFLGEVESNRLDKVRWALTSAVPQPPAFQLHLGYSGSFSDRHAPSVIWAGIEVVGSHSHPSPAHNLAEAVTTWLAASGFPRERRGFIPHLTLARLPQNLDADTRRRIAVLTNAVPAPALPDFTVDSVSLMRSHLGPGGARYERLASFPS